MSGIGRLFQVLALAGSLTLGFGLAHMEASAAVPEWNPVRTHSVQIGPEASRLVVGFRPTAGNALVKSIKIRAQTQSVRIVQANTSDADAAGLAARAGLTMAKSRQVTPSMHVL